MLLKYISLQCSAKAASGKEKANFHKSFPSFLFMSMEHFIWLCETLKRCYDLTKPLSDLHWIKVAFLSDLQGWRGCVTKIRYLKDSARVLSVPRDPFPSIQVPSKNPVSRLSHFNSRHWAATIWFPKAKSCLNLITVIIVIKAKFQGE